MNDGEFLKKKQEILEKLEDEQEITFAGNITEGFLAITIGQTILNQIIQKNATKSL